MVSIIIPTPNNKILVMECVKSIQANTNDYEIVFVVDETVQFREELERIGKVVFCSLPFVFSKRINEGVKAAEGEYLCFLNADTTVNPGWLKKAIKADKELGPGLTAIRTQRGGCSNYDAHGEGEMRYTNSTINMCGMLLTRRVYDIIGPLDERFIYYGGEDDDYCLRALRNNLPLIVSEGSLFHKVGCGFDPLMVQKLLPKTKHLFLNKWLIDLPTPPNETWDDNARRTATLPLVSILMPTRNHAKYIKSAVLSVLKQDYKNIQLIVGIDGKDQEETQGILKDIYDTHFEKRNPSFLILKTNDQVGSCDMRNRCFGYAAGEFICLMDSDDIMLRTRITSQLGAMLADTDIVHSNFILENKNGKTLHKLTDVTKQKLINLETVIAGGTFFMRRYCLEKEAFDPVYDRAFDFEYTLRTIGKFRYKHIENATIIYRRHDGEHLSGNAESHKLHKEIIQKYREADNIFSCNKSKM